MGPSMRWNRQHEDKISYTELTPAQKHADELNAKRPGRTFSAYECRWGQWYRDGETAPMHYHVGRERTKEKDHA